MKGTSLSRAERETVITFNDEDDTANVFSCMPTWMTKIKKLDGWRPCGAGVEIDVPKKWIRIQRPNKYTKESVESSTKRLEKMRSKR